MMQWLQPATLNATPDGERCRLDRTIDCAREGRSAFFDHDARQSAEHDLNLANLIATALWSIGVRQTTVIRSMDDASFPSFIPSFLVSGQSGLVLHTPSVHHQDGDRRMVEGALGDAPEEQTVDAAGTPRAHNQQVRTGRANGAEEVA